MMGRDSKGSHLLRGFTNGSLSSGSLPRRRLLLAHVLTRLVRTHAEGSISREQASKKGTGRGQEGEKNKSSAPVSKAPASDGTMQAPVSRQS